MSRVAPPLLLLRRSGCARCDAGEDRPTRKKPARRLGLAGLSQCQVALAYWKGPSPMLTDPYATCARQLGC